MMLYPPNQYLAQIVLPCLNHLGWQEENLGLVLAAIPYSMEGQPQQDQFGPYQMSHHQHWAIWDNYLAKDEVLASQIRGLASQHRFTDNPDVELQMNAGYATAMAAAGLYAHTKHKNLPADFYNLAFLWQEATGQTLSLDAVISLYPGLKNQWPVAC